MQPASRLVVSIIIPAYNEAGTIQDVLDKVAGVPLHIEEKVSGTFFPGATGGLSASVSSDTKTLDKEIIVVDDGSRDDTCRIVDDWLRRNPAVSARLIRQPVNAGKGAAVRTGIAAATGHILLIQDADLEYDPTDYPVLLQPIVAGQAVVVYGSRLDPRSRPNWLSRRQWVANRVLTGMTNLLCRSHLTDMETCYKAFRCDAIKLLPLTADRFDIEPEITVKLLRNGHKITEVPIRYQARTKQQGKKIKWHDGLHGLWAILKYRFVH